jgi:hypothetical protein
MDYSLLEIDKDIQQIHVERGLAFLFTSNVRRRCRTITRDPAHQ